MNDLREKLRISEDQLAAINALITALAIITALDIIRSDTGWRRQALRAFGGAVAIFTGIALILPWHYAAQLGPREGSLSSLKAITDWMKESGVPDGARVYMLPQIDPTDNLHAMGGYLPPTFVTQIYPWFTDDPHVIPSFLRSLDETPPPYGLLFERFRDSLPHELLDYLESHYIPLGQFTAPDRMGTVTLYKRKP